MEKMFVSDRETSKLVPRGGIEPQAVKGPPIQVLRYNHLATRAQSNKSIQNVKFKFQICIIFYVQTYLGWLGIVPSPLNLPFFSN